jgi:cytochrome c5
MACHGAGIAGAPKAGDKASWSARIAKGKATLYQSALKGLNAMPAKGGQTALPDADVKAAVDYMLNQIK